MPPADIGTRIKRARERKRWTQRQLADALEVSIKSVDNWENGRTSPRSSIGAIEEILGITDAEPEPDPVSPRLRQVAIEELGEAQGKFVISAIRAALRGEDVPRRNHRRAAAS